MNQRAVNKYLTLESELRAKHPNILKIAESLAEDITDVRVADVDAIWKQLWPKPLYANARQEVAKRWRERLMPFMKDPRDWEKKIQFTKVGQNMSESSFRSTTKLAREIKRESRIAQCRLFAIQGSAVALCTRARERETPFSDLYSQSIRERVETLRKEFGYGWGYTTVLHFLTDLGLGCKPDRHLFRTIQHIQGVPVDEVTKAPTLEQAMTAVDFVNELAKGLYGSILPRKVRFLDKVLMEIWPNVLEPK